MKKQREILVSSSSLKSKHQSKNVHCLETEDKSENGSSWLSPCLSRPPLPSFSLCLRYPTPAVVSLWLWTSAVRRKCPKLLRDTIPTSMENHDDGKQKELPVVCVSSPWKVLPSPRLATHCLRGPHLERSKTVQQQKLALIFPLRSPVGVHIIHSQNLHTLKGVLRV